MNRSFDIIGKISRFEDWKISLAANETDEIVFHVHKYADGILCPVWDDLIDLKIVEVSGFGRFEISVDYTDNTETVKSVHGFSLETELAQIGLYEFHVNDEDAADMKDNYDSDGNFIPTTFYREISEDDTPETAESKRKHSLLHRALADKAPHWSIGYVTPYIALDEETRPEESSKFQRTYTVDGDSIYDFLTGAVAEESNVVFVFDTIGREINCYSLCDCIDQETGEVLCNGIGEDTFVFVSKNKLANEITISSNKDNVKNCFRIEGGDDVITDMVRAVNMNGSNYIYQFADFQYNDMSEELKKKIKDYQDEMSSKEVQDEYYGENGIYTRLCNAYDELAYYESSMMPNTDMVTDPGKAKEQYNKIVNELTADGSFVAVSSLNNYDDNLFVGVTNNVEAYAQVFLDSRFDLEIVRGTTSYSYDKDKKIGTWKGKIRITQHTDETNVYPVDVDNAPVLEIKVNEDVLEFAKQKVYKALSKASLADIDFDVAEMDETGIRAYFNQYSLNRLQSFSDAYNSCISILATLGQTTTSEVQNELYNTYERRYEIVESVKDERQKQVDEIKQKISDIQKEQKRFQEDHDFVTHLGEHYKEFCAYRREDVYKNDNYISDGRTTSECLAKAKELIEAAEKEAKKACVLQRIVSTSLNNLFALPEFEPLYDKFALYNYIRIRTEDEILKLRLIGIDFSGDSVEKIDVTFSEQIESIDGTLSDLQSIIHQAKSMATSYPSTALQAKHGAEANSEIADIYDNGLNAEKTMFANNDNNEVTITQSGIICKRMDNEGFYDGKQLRITGNVMAFTNDDWKTVKTAIGERIFKDSNTLEEEVGYGIIADNIIGKLIASDKCIIGNKENNVVITGDGITIKNGTITWRKNENGNGVNAPEINDIDGLSEFKDRVNTALTGSTTEIGSDYVISPKIGGGYLFIEDKRPTEENTGISVEINPNGTEFVGHKGNYVFNISKGEDLVMGVRNDGNGHFSGEIKAKEGHIANFNIKENKLCTDNVEFNDSTGIYFGENGLRIGDNFKVGKDGDISIDGDIRLKNSLYIWYDDKYEMGEGPGYYQCLKIGELSEAVVLSLPLTTQINDLIVSESLYSSCDIYAGRNLTINGDLIAHGSYNNVGTSVPNLMIGGAHKIRMTSGSSKRFKTEIKPVDADDLNPDKLYDVDIVQYKFKKDYLSEDDQRYDKEVIGFIAEDIYEKYPIAADYSIDDKGNTIVNDWNFRYMVPAMLKLIQDQKKEIDVLKQENSDFKQRLENLEKKFV